MHESWFYCPVLQCGEVVLDESETRHALQSRRLHPGDTLTVFDGLGHVSGATILPGIGSGPQAASTGPYRSKRHRQVRLLVSTVQNVPPPSRRLTLIFPACKGARLAWLIEKCTELGVARLILAEFERSVVHAGPEHARKLRRTAIEACKQCRRAWLPAIEAGVNLNTAVAAEAGSALLVAHRDTDAVRLADWLARHLPAAAQLVVVIGPEGGLAPEELVMLGVAGGQQVHLSEHVLRTETAAVAVAATWAAQTIAAI